MNVRKLRPAILGLALYGFAIPFEAVSLGGIQSVAAGAGLIAVIFLIPDVAVAHVRSTLRSRIAILAILYGVLSALSVLWSVQPADTTSRMRTLLPAVIIFVLMASTSFTTSELRFVTGSFVLGTWVTCVMSFAAPANVPYYISESLARHTAASANPNDLALNAAIAIPLAIVVSNHRRWPAILYILTAIPAIALTGSRGGAIAGGVALLATFAYAVKDGRLSIKFLLALPVAVLVGIAYAPPVFLERIGQLSGQVESGSFSGRGLAWGAAFRNFFSEPLIGSGSGTSTFDISRTLGATFVAHDTLLDVAVDLGLIGLLIFLALVLSVVAAVFRAKSNTWRGAWMFSLLSWAVGSSVLSWDYRKTTWLLLAVAAVAVDISREKPAQSPQPMTAVLEAQEHA